MESFADEVSQEESRQTFGWIEKIKIYPSGLELHAKLDTGADHCSLSAQNIESFSRRGKTWVRFNIRNKKGVKRTVETLVHRTTKIKRTSGKSEERYVVKLGVCVGQKYMLVDMNLADRSNFSYPVLIGRSFLSVNGIVDSSQTYVTRPLCDFSKES